jgi:flagellar FliL protein
MTDQALAQNADADGADDAEASDAPKATGKMPGKKLILFIVLPLLLLIGGGAGVYFSGLADSLLGKEEHAAEETAKTEPVGPSVYYELPDMLVNLNNGGKKAGYLKISVSLELGSEEDRLHVESILPRVVDSFQVYLRELRVQDLQGSAGLQRLREELLLRVSAAATPAKVKDVLFREMLIQ